MAAAVDMPLVPLWLQGGSHSADVMRTLLAAQFFDGVSDPAALKVTQRAAGANISVDVAPGTGYVTGDSGVGTRGYVLTSDTATNVTLDAVPGSNSRIDLIVAKVLDNAVGGGGFNKWQLVPISGTAGASPTAPAVPDNSVLLAQITVASGAATIVNANIADWRTPMHQTTTVTSTTRFAKVRNGAMLVESDTGDTLVGKSSAWVNITAGRQEMTFVDGAIFGGTPPNEATTHWKTFYDNQTIAFIAGAGTITIPGGYFTGGIVQFRCTPAFNGQGVDIGRRTTGSPALSLTQIPISACLNVPGTGPELANGMTIALQIEVIGW